VKGTPYDAQLVQAENLKLAQSRIIELEKELEKLRKENELLSSAGEMTKQKLEEATGRIHQFEKQKNDRQTQFENEVRIFKDGLSQKDYENQKLRLKVEELEGRISADLRKIRVRERELENRLELLKAEKTALVRSKDETILDLKRKIDSVQVEIENYKSKVIELNQKIESNQEQFNRTIRTLRLALTNLEVNDPTISSSNVGVAGPFKKAE
jgi:chromosome segregation ATPase